MNEPEGCFFGEADYGKSTLIGYLYANAQYIDLKRAEAKMCVRMGKNYKPEVLLPSLINPDSLSSETTQTVKVRTVTDADSYEEGIQIIKDTDEEIVVQSTSYWL